MSSSQILVINYPECETGGRIQIENFKAVIQSLSVKEHIPFTVLTLIHKDCPEEYRKNLVFFATNLGSRIEFSFSYQDNSGKDVRWIIREIRYTFTAGETLSEYATSSLSGTFPTDKLLEYASTNEGTLDFTWKIKAITNTPISRYVKVEEEDQYELTSENQGSAYFKDDFSDPDLADVEIVCQDQKFYCSLFILAKRSDVFRAMFKENNFKESKEKKVSIDDVSPNTLRAFLTYLYTSRIPQDLLDKAPLEELFSCADMYNVPCLAKIVKRRMIKTVSVENVIQRLELACLHEAEDLKAKSLDFFVRTYSNAEYAKEWLKRLSVKRPELAKRAMEMLADK